MKSENTIVKFAIFILFFTMVALILVSGTYARYVSTSYGSDTATVAKWVFNVTDKNGNKVNVAGTTAKELEFDIFSTLSGDTSDSIKKVDGSLIAPGTTGSFTVALENASEVKAEFKTKYEVTNASNVPLEYSLDKQSWSSSIADICDSDFTEIGIGATANTKTIYWRWAFTDAQDEDRDTTDTALAVNTTLPTVTVKATIDVQQVDQ